MHKILESLKDELWKGFSTAEVTVMGRVFVLKTLNDGEEVWRDKYVVASAALNYLTGKAAPTVAIALVSIDGIPVRDLFLSDEEKVQTAQTIAVEEYLKYMGFKDVGERLLVAQRAHTFLSELPSEIIDVLYKECTQLEKTKSEMMVKLLKPAQPVQPDGKG